MLLLPAARHLLQNLPRIDMVVQLKAPAVAPAVPLPPPFPRPSCLPRKSAIRGHTTQGIPATPGLLMYSPSLAPTVGGSPDWAVYESRHPCESFFQLIFPVEEPSKPPLPGVVMPNLQPPDALIPCADRKDEPAWDMATVLVWLTLVGRQRHIVGCSWQIVALWGDEATK